MNEWMKAKHQSRDRVPDVPFAWLTVETALWGLVLFVALGLRLLRLGAAPLDASEARGALAAWRFVGGEGVQAGTDYSPILFFSQWFTFLFFGANDLAARILPALAGTALVLSPALLRRYLGRLGALVAGALLALSPTALTLSRTASGDILVAVGAMLCTGGLWRFSTSTQNDESTPAQPPFRPPFAAYLAPIGVALMLVSSPLAYSALLAMGTGFLLLVILDTSTLKRFKVGWATVRTTPNLASYTLGTFVGSWVLLSTSFGWNFGGLGAAAGLLPEWLDGFLRSPDSLNLGYPALILVFYEPLILQAGAVGMILAAARMDPYRRFLVLWSVGALLLAIVRPGRGPGDVLLSLVPLVCLGGLTLATLLKDLRRDGSWFSEGFYLVITAPLWAYLLINLATYSNQPAQYTRIALLFIDVSLPTFLSLVIVTTFLLIILAVGIGFVHGPMAAFRGLGLSTLLALLLYTGAAGYGVSQNRAADPRELLIVRPTMTDVRLLAESLSKIAREHSGEAHAIDLTVLSDDPVLAWILRDFKERSGTDEAEAESLTSAVVTAYSEGTLPLGEDYIGQIFPLRRRWEWDTQGCRWNPVQVGTEQVRQLDCSALVDWLVYRRGREQPIEEQVVLWVRKDLLGW